jgi:hypothetical protein
MRYCGLGVGHRTTHESTTHLKEDLLNAMGVDLEDGEGSEDSGDEVHDTVTDEEPAQSDVGESGESDIENLPEDLEAEVSEEEDGADEYQAEYYLGLNDE